jgi:hypothetical protein
MGIELSRSPSSSSSQWIRESSGRSTIAVTCCVYAKPGCKCHRALNLVSVRPHFGDGGVAADHGHDALVLVAKIGAFLAGDVVKNVPGSPGAGLLSD